MLPVSRRIAEVRKRRLCMNCLRSTSHTQDKCISGHCKLCKAKHNTLLHDATVPVEPRGHNEKAGPTSSLTALHTYESSDTLNYDRVILSTAIVHMYDSEGDVKPCRALLDCGSQANFISKFSRSRSFIRGSSSFLHRSSFSHRIYPSQASTKRRRNLRKR